MKPPPTTKVGITAKGGYQAEAHYFLCGLDIEEKAALLERQVRYGLDESKYHCLKFRANGRCPDEPRNQDAATVDLRIFAQSKDESALSMKNFFRPVSDTIMQSYPGATFAVDIRQSAPKPYYEYWVALLPQAKIKHVCHLPSKNLSIPIPPPEDTLDFVRQQETYETKNAIDLSTLGSTTRAPLGHVVHARSGDKGSDCNVGFFVRSKDEWDWLRSLLTVDKIREMMGDDDTGKPIFRFELPNISGKWRATKMRRIILANHSEQVFTSFSRIIWTEAWLLHRLTTCLGRTWPNICVASGLTSQIRSWIGAESDYTWKKTVNHFP